MKKGYMVMLHNVNFLIVFIYTHRTESSDGSDFELAPGSREAFDWKRSRVFSRKFKERERKL